jgi:hypothetical protein
VHPATLTPLLIPLINRSSARVLSFTIVLRKRKKRGTAQRRERSLRGVVR